MHKMKAVFLTLLLGLVCAGQEAPAQPEASEVPKFCWSGRRSWFCECVCVFASEKESCSHEWPACVRQYIYTHTLWYTCLQEHNTTLYLPALWNFFFPSYLSVCEGERKANMPSFRELWTVMIFKGVILAISRNSEFYSFCWTWIIISSHVIWQGRR